MQEINCHRLTYLLILLPKVVTASLINLYIFFSVFDKELDNSNHRLYWRLRRMTCLLPLPEESQTVILSLDKRLDPNGTCERKEVNITFFKSVRSLTVYAIIILTMFVDIFRRRDVQFHIHLFFHIL